MITKQAKELIKKRNDFLKTQEGKDIVLLPYGRTIIDRQFFTLIQAYKEEINFLGGPKYNNKGEIVISLDGLSMQLVNESYDEYVLQQHEFSRYSHNELIKIGKILKNLNSTIKIKNIKKIKKKK